MRDINIINIQSHDPMDISIKAISSDSTVLVYQKLLISTLVLSNGLHRYSIGSQLINKPGSILNTQIMQDICTAALSSAIGNLTLDDRKILNSYDISVQQDVLHIICKADFSNGTEITLQVTV